MPEEKSTAEVSPEIRPRVEVAADLSATREAMRTKEQSITTLLEEPEMANESNMQAVGGLIEKTIDAAVLEEEVAQMVPEAVRPTAQRAWALAKEYKVLVARQQALEVEFTPYRREDFERMVDSLSARLNYQTVFEHYQELHDRFGIGDSFTDTVRELYFLRRFQYFRLHTTEGARDYRFYDEMCDLMEKFGKRWEEKGLLSETPREDYQMSAEFGASPRQERQAMLAQMEPVLADLEKFNVLSGTYRMDLSGRYPFDFELSAIYRTLNFVREEHAPTDYEGFEDVDFDPGFIQAAIVYVNGSISRHRTAGHLPDNDQTREQERKRIDQLPGAELGSILIEGFDVPEGMRGVITPQEVLEELQRLLPPDFVHGLRALRWRAERPAADVPGGEVMGRFIPEHDANMRVVAAEIEIYHPFFVPEGTDEVMGLVRRREFMNTAWHEFGHNAHHLLRFEELEQWEGLLQKDATPITPYVAAARDIGGYRGKMEDFAESFAMFITNPLLLETLSVERYKFMVNFASSRIRTDQQQAFANNLFMNRLYTGVSWKSNGYTEEDIRKLYLGN